MRIHCKTPNYLTAWNIYVLEIDRKYSLARELNRMGFWGNIRIRNRSQSRISKGKKMSNQLSSALHRCPSACWTTGKGAVLLQDVHWGAEKQLLHRQLNTPASPGPRKQTPCRCKVEQVSGWSHWIRRCLLNREKGGGLQTNGALLRHHLEGRPAEVHINELPLTSGNAT